MFKIRRKKMLIDVHPVQLLMLTQHYSSQLSTVNCDRSSIDFVMSEEEVVVVGTHWAASGAPSLMLGCCNGSLTSPLSHFTLTEILFWHASPLS